MNNENKTTNPFKEAENEYNPLDNNSDNMQDESSSNNYDNREEINNPYGNNLDSYENDTTSFFNQNIDEEDYQSNETNYSNQNTYINNNFYNDEDYQDNNYENTYQNDNASSNANPLLKKLPIVLLILVLIIALVLLLKSLISNPETTNPNINVDENSEIKIKEEILNKRVKVENYNLFNGNILLKINNRNSENIDSTFAIDFYNEEGKIVKTDDVTVKNIHANSIYYESVIVPSEYKGLKYEINNKITINKFKKYHNKDVEIINTTESEDLEVEIKNNTSITINYIKIYAIYYDEQDNIIGFYDSSTKDLGGDKSTIIKLGYPKDADYKIISYNRSEVGVDTAYTYKD